MINDLVNELNTLCNMKQKIVQLLIIIGYGKNPKITTIYDPKLNISTDIKNVIINIGNLINNSDKKIITQMYDNNIGIFWPSPHNTKTTFVEWNTKHKNEKNKVIIEIIFDQKYKYKIQQSRDNILQFLLYVPLIISIDLQQFCKTTNVTKTDTIPEQNNKKV